ncbi:small G protein signaling modulator 2-like isoform X1 [Leucoraja erinacea]|uniref:small G protein signaling modulator 2-like isoform X1 n=1 Tax=Leucoraja erinaceus TaxID=7782 RepID=UPI0024574734|nr:small G protein signaling modulator 2-like isoform X1 [Leucoraja erinacea]
MFWLIFSTAAEMSTSRSSECTEDEAKQKLLWNVKREVKQIMEEAVTRKFVHEDSSHIIGLCTVVEACLLYLLKRRAAGFLRSDKVAALFTKVGKIYPVAGDVCAKVQELQQQTDNKKKPSNGQESLKRQGSLSKPPPLTPQAIKHIWVRTALFEKVLDKIVQYIVDNSSKYYEKQALIADPVCGPILASLLVGPCALEYTKLKTADHYWTDPSADELVQRHRIHCAHGHQDSPSKRPALGIRKRQSSGSMSEDKFAASAREYVESLHQNSRTHLLYGKNNVLVQPKEDVETVPGYLSLHQSADHLTLKWTPNQLMNGTLGDSELEKSVYWDYALTVPLHQIVCIHCHQQPDSGDTLVLVSQDGIQRPPLHFPQGGHLLAFLSCLENGLLPRGQLDPPLWSQRGKGKVFPKLRKRNSRVKSIDQEEPRVEEVATDYVFRIIYNGQKNDYDPSELLVMHGCSGTQFPWQLGDACSHGSPCLSCSSSGSPYDVPIRCSCGNDRWSLSHHRTPLKMLCENMKRQIVSRAFYGWLAYCRHLSTVRTHLSALVNHTIVPSNKPSEASGGLTAEVWNKYEKDRKNYKKLELLRMVYYGGVQHEIRKDVWPFLLGHYKFGMSKQDMDQVDEDIAAKYRYVMSEWKACELVVKQRDRETHSAILAKLSSGSSIDSHVQHLIHRDSTISNDVFISVDEGDLGEKAFKLAEEARTIVNVDAPAAVVEERPSIEFDSPDSGLPSSRNYSVASGHSRILSSTDDQSLCMEEGVLEEEDQTELGRAAERARDVSAPGSGRRDALQQAGAQDSLCEEQLSTQLDLILSEKGSASLPSMTYTTELMDAVSLNWHRIDKDVQRCDRNYWYFTTINLERLKSIMCSYVWEHLEVGYVQGMCDLLAPLMVIMDSEPLAYSCFTQLMKRMNQNFPNGGAMDTHFANMRSLIQILDSELFELMHQNGDYTHFYFCYRWFLLDFKRELLYEDVFAVWEVIWAAKHISSEHFVLFIALALVEVYREIIRDNNMDFTDIIKFFNEMAERHDTQQILRIARELVYKVQTLIENK